MKMKTLSINHRAGLVTMCGPITWVGLALRASLGGHRAAPSTTGFVRARYSAVVVLLLAFCLLFAVSEARAGAPPVVTSVTAAQRAGTKLVDISYTISDPNFTSINVFVLVSTDSGATWDKAIAKTFIGGSAVGTNVAVTTTPTGKTITWDAGADWDGHYAANCRVRVLANNVGLVLIPPGSFTRGKR